MYSKVCLEGRSDLSLRLYNEPGKLSAKILSLLRALQLKTHEQASKRDRDRRDKPRGIGMENSEP